MAAPLIRAEAGTAADGEATARGPGARTIAAAAALYLAVLLLDGHRVFAHLGSVLPATLPDPLQHLWILRWYSSCLAHWRSPLFAPDVMYPVGAPLGLYSPLHLQAILFELFGLAVPGDVARYNLLWACGFLFTAAGGFALSWRLLRDRTAAVFGGLLCLLATPVSMHAFGHLELLYVGAFAFFALAWIDFVARPRRRSFAAALLTYVLLAMSAAYFSVMATIPAALFVVWSGARAARGGGFRDWFRALWRWLLGFAVAAAIALACLFASQLWASAHDLEAPRGRIEFARYGTTLWSYLTPTPFQRAEEILPWQPYRHANFGLTLFERASYLGIVPLLLIWYAAVRRPRFAEAGYWWAAFALCVILSLGAFRALGLHQVPLPADWLWRFYPPMRELRVPARFNLFAAVIASLLAAAGLSRMLARVERPGLRRLLAGGVFVATIADLAPRPYPGVELPKMPEVYGRILARDPAASFHEAPYFGTRGLLLPAATAYWQSFHGGKTSGGYSGMTNAGIEYGIAIPSPFFARNLSYPSYLEDPSRQDFDIVRADAGDYLWAFLHRHGYRYAVVFRDPAYFPELHGSIERLLILLEGAEVDRDDATIAYAADLLPSPKRAVAVPISGLRNRQYWRGIWSARAGRRIEIALYNPTPGEPIVLRLGAASFKEERSARVVLSGGAGDRTLLRFRAFPSFRWYESDPFLAPQGWSTLVIESASASPQDPEKALWGTDRRPISLWIGAIVLQEESEVSAPNRPAAERPDLSEDFWGHPKEP